jgi:addiction module HigA family antidote
MPMKNPPHPGDLIRTEVIEALGLTVSKAAEILQVRRATLSDLLHGKAALTPEMALRIEKAFGPDMDHLLRMQLAYDVAKTREHARRIPVKPYAPAKRQALAELRKRLHTRKAVASPINTARLVREEREAR